MEADDHDNAGVSRPTSASSRSSFMTGLEVLKKVIMGRSVENSNVVGA